MQHKRLRQVFTACPLSRFVMEKLLYIRSPPHVAKAVLTNVSFLATKGHLSNPGCRCRRAEEEASESTEVRTSTFAAT